MDIKEYEDHAKIHLPELQEDIRPHLPGHCISEFYEDTSPFAEDLIAPALIIPGSVNFLFGQAKVGKTLFLQTWMFYMACGLNFVGLEPERPLKVYMCQLELPYPALRKRINSLYKNEPGLEKIYKDGHKGNFHIKYNVDILINSENIGYFCDEIDHAFPDGSPDIIIIDPMVNVFDHKEFGEENNNSNMYQYLKFLKQKIIAERFPDSSLLITHHISKMSYDRLMEDPFNAPRGASAIRGFYDSAIMMVKKPNSNVTHLLFEQRHADENEHISRKDLTISNGIYGESNPKPDVINENRHPRAIRQLDDNMQGVYNYMLEESECGRLLNVNTLSEEYCKDGYDDGQIVFNTIQILKEKGKLNYKEDGTILLL